jgi:hypothetical protein
MHLVNPWLAGQFWEVPMSGLEVQLLFGRDFYSWVCPLNC